jgi:plasmid stabilization system protein ParE
VERLHRFLADVSPEAAARVAAAILAGAEELTARPDVGRPIGDGRREWFVPFGVGAYGLRYRIDPAGNVVVIRVWHSREDCRES